MQAARLNRSHFGNSALKREARTDHGKSKQHRPADRCAARDEMQRVERLIFGIVWISSLPLRFKGIDVITEIELSRSTMPQSHLREQIELIARHEREFLHRRTASERMGDAIGSFIGSVWFIAIHVLWIGAWIASNTLHRFTHFDPSPFPLLDTIVAIEAIFLASFIVMRQSRLGRRADERAHLILQILILTEREITAVLGIERQ